MLDDIYNHLFDSDRNFYLYDDEVTSDDPLVYHPPPLDEVWLSEPERWARCLELEERRCIAEDQKKVKWIDKTPDDPSDSLPNLIEQSDSDSETSDQPPPVFVPEGGNVAAQQDEDDESIVPLNAPDEGALSNIPFADFNDIPFASDAASVADSYSSNEHDSKHLCQSKQRG